MKQRTILFLAALLALVPMGSQALAAIGAGELRCEYRENPLGIDAVKPRLSWILQDTKQERGQTQTAYQILVASSRSLLAKDEGDLWDSGKIVSDQTAQIEYDGKPLESRQHCYWKMRAWDLEEKASAWSAPSEWSMGLLNLGDWAAHWIGYDAACQPSPEAARDDKQFNLQGLKWVACPTNAATLGFATLLRKTIVLPADRKVQKAVLALYAFNACTAEINGVSIGEAAHWERTARLDATQALRAGTNVLALTATHTDPYNAAAIGRLVIRFDSGDDLIVPLDETWKVSQRLSNDWKAIGYDDSAWLTAVVLDVTPWRGPPAVADLARVPAPYLRKEFSVAKAVKRATVYVTALGVYELRLNGQRVGNDVLTPGWTEFRKRVHYQTYDVTAQVKRGDNAIGAILGDGWYASTLAHLGKRNVYDGKPRFLARLDVELSDGTIQSVVTDDSWKACYGPILHADLLMGCEYDARLVLPGWDKPGFNATAWHPVADSGETIGKDPVILQAAVAEPSRRCEELPALKVTEPKPGCYTFDLGQNMVGWVRLKVHGEAGQRITVRHSEMLNADGTVYTASLRSCPATDYYLLSGKGDILEPYFTFHGFRYVEVRGLKTRPSLEMVTGVVVHSVLRRTGNFECSYPLLNQLYKNIIWGQKGNYLEIPTDCPQRDERMGWTGDTQFFAPTAAYNFDVAAIFTRWLATCRDDQFADGSFPHVVPDIMGSGGATAWGDAALICTYNIYKVYGDTRLVRQQFDAMEHYMRWLDSKTKNGISTVGGFGDWLNAGGGAKAEAIDTAYHVYLAQIMSEMATGIGRTEEARRYAALHDELRGAFIKAFVNEDGSLKDCSQTGYALAFIMGLVPDELKEKSAAKFVGEIQRFDWHLATGFIGTPRLLPALNNAGRNDVAYRLLFQDTYPSWLFPVKNGATTMWERWNGWTPDHGFGDITMNSYNHYAFGAVGEYLYGGVGGIQAASPGYKTIRIQPVIGEGLTWAKTRFDSIHGPIVSDWKRDGTNLTMNVTIPANTSANIFVPARDLAHILEAGKPADQSKGVSFLRMEKSAAVFAVGSGSYKFESVLDNN